MPYQPILLSSYRLPAQYPMTLAEEDMACWLNAATALWHPAALACSRGPVQFESAYDHETPKAGCLYALPDTPASYLPDDWEERVVNAGARAFRATPDREQTLANLQAAVPTDTRKLWRLPPTDVHACLGLGWGWLLYSALVEAMQHTDVLDHGGFWEELQHAVRFWQGEPSPSDTAFAPSTDHVETTPSERQHVRNGALEFPDARSALVAAAQRLSQARDVLCPMAIHNLIVFLLDGVTPDLEPMLRATDAGLVANALLPAEALSRIPAEQVDRLRTAVQATSSRVEILGGSYLEREDAILPLDSQLWNVQHGLATWRDTLGVEPRVYARRRYGFSPQTPLQLSTQGLQRALFLAFDESAALPQSSALIAAWSSPDGKQVDAIMRPPKLADADAFFNLGHAIYKTTREDSTPTIFLMVAANKPWAPWLNDLAALSQLAPVFGEWEPLSRYFDQTTPSDFPPQATADDFHFDYLTERVEAKVPGPVSAFARHVRARRRVDACWTLAALHRALGGNPAALTFLPALAECETLIESRLGDDAPGLADLEQQAGWALAERLQVRAATGTPGWMVLNPCGFARRAALELPDARGVLPIEGVVKASELEGTTQRAVIEIPALGFSWLPRDANLSAKPTPLKFKNADPALRIIRNEFLEVEVDGATGGMKAIRDLRTRINRLGQQLVFNPSGAQGRMVVREVVVKAGNALAEIVSEGAIVNEQNQDYAHFRQRFRLWVGRPLLELRIEIVPTHPPVGYPWHSYFASRFAWRDERDILVRSFGSAGHVTLHPRPQTSDYLELRYGKQNTVLLTGGLPFHHKQQGRMVDVILIPEGETCTTFDLAIALDRDQPMQTALGYVSPLIVVPTEKGPPHIGASGWLGHLDASNLMLTRIMPGTFDNRDAEAVVARLLECAGASGFAEFRTARNPVRASLRDARGKLLVECNVHGDAVNLEVTPNDLVHCQLEFTAPSG